ncbi:MAG: hypothetical protein PHS02_02645 [Candidatus ainarchaeum sp.]|nr:hypothetical protein [Candidatus ainarchaeum sp.]
MKYLASTEAEEWIAETRISKPSDKVEFGQYAIYLDEGVLVMKNKLRGQIDLLSSAKFGIPQLSACARLVFSGCLEKDGRSGNAGFFVLDEGWKKAVYFSASYSGDDVTMHTTDYELEFRVSRDYDASAFMGSLMVMDRKSMRYRMMMPNGRTLSAQVRLGKNSFCFMVNRELGLIANGKELHLIHDDVRSLIGLEAELTRPLMGLGKKNGCDWLIVKDAGWKKKCVAIALSGPGKYCYAIAELTEKPGKGDSEGPMR